MVPQEADWLNPDVDRTGRQVTHYLPVFHKEETLGFYFLLEFQCLRVETDRKKERICNILLSADNVE